MAYKYQGQRWWAGVFARLMAGLLVQRPSWFEEFDVLLAVPGYVGPDSRRRWDPMAGVMAELRGRLVGWDVCEGLVVKDADTAPLTGRRHRDRAAAAESQLRRALRVAAPASVAGHRVLVVDDVLTDGATLREVALALLGAGAAEVAGLVLARAVVRGVSRTLA